jgi:hypothetical protein
MDMEGGKVRKYKGFRHTIKYLTTDTKSITVE